MKVKNTISKLKKITRGFNYTLDEEELMSEFQLSNWNLHGHNGKQKKNEKEWRKLKEPMRLIYILQESQKEKRKKKNNKKYFKIMTIIKGDFLQVYVAKSTFKNQSMQSLGQDGRVG